MLLLAAHAYRRDSEDRLTEIFATALDAHPGFWRTLSDELKLPPGERYEVETQYRVSPECRLDMRVQASGEHGEVSAVVYSEHKIDGYWFSEGQVERERQGLDAEPAAKECKRLICIVSENELAELKPVDPAAPIGVVSAADFDQSLSWRGIAQLAHAAGEGWPAPWGGANWTRRALEPDAPAAQRILAEFVAYLQGDKVLGPLSADEIRAIHLADRAWAKTEQLLRLVATGAGSFIPVRVGKGEFVYYDHSATGVTLACVNFAAPPGHWLLNDEDNALTLVLATADAGAPWHSEEPMVYAGLYISPECSEEAEADSAWMAAAVSRDFHPLAYEGGFWPCRSRPLAALLEPGARLDDQAKAVGQWVTEALEAAISLPEPPEKPAAAGGPDRR